MIKFKVWWMPQVGSPAGTFEVPVSSREEGQKICKVLASYDLFQYENKVKGDYANAGGVVAHHPAISEDENDWFDVPEDDDEWADYMDEIVEWANKQNRRDPA